MSRVALALAFALIVSATAAQPAVHPRLCVVPVTAPADVDLGPPRQMTNEVLMLPGAARPVIYPFDRAKGVWTVDGHRLVPFPGASRSQGEPYRFATDTRRQRIIGIGAFSGVYALEDSGFRLLRGVDPRGLGRPDDIRFGKRLDAFLVFDPNGIFQIDRSADEVVPLRQPAVVRLADGSFDIPVLDARLVTRGRDVTLVHDDGAESVVLTLSRHDPKVLEVKVSPSGGLYVRTATFEYTVSTAHPNVAWSRFGIGRALPNLPVDVILREAGAPLRFADLIYDQNGLRGTHPDGRPRDVALPFDPKQTPIQAIGELAEALIVITTNHVYALDRSLAATVVAAGDKVGADARIRSIGPNAMLVAGERGLFQIVDRPEACGPP